MVYSVNFLPAGALPAKVFGTKDKTLNAMHRTIQPVRFLPQSHSSEAVLSGFQFRATCGFLVDAGWKLEVKFIEAFDGIVLNCCAVLSHQIDMCVLKQFVG